MEFADALINILNSTVRVSVPLLLACLAGLYSERAGVFDIGLEGKMLAGAFAGAAAAAVSGSAWIGLAAAMLISVFMALVHGFASITHRGNQIVSGVAINFIAAGSTIILGQAWFQQGGRTPALSGPARFSAIELPGAAAMRGMPIVGTIYSELISGHSVLVYVAFLMVPFTWWVLFRTRFGLRLRAVGENPAAVDTAGISVAWLRYRAVICTGILTGVAGAYLSVAQNAGFVKDMTAGKGFIALAALIFAKWRPVPAMFACLLFGFLEAASIRFQGLPWPVIGKVPVQLMQALPYVLTVILLRMVGVMAFLPTSVLTRLLPWGMLGYAINTMSGMLFFAAAPQQYVDNPAFYWKLVFLLLAASNVLYFTFDDGWQTQTGRPAPALTKALAASALFFWVGVMYWGSMLPFIGNAF